MAPVSAAVAGSTLREGTETASASFESAVLDYLNYGNHQRSGSDDQWNYYWRFTKGLAVSQLQHDGHEHGNCRKCRSGHPERSGPLLRSSEPFQRGHRSGDDGEAATHEAPVPLREMFEVS
ncbi:hypothetical protein ACGFYA_04305, partial [Streptomyces sp. NPDC048305]|uniref:hypothetical protein n=1 Tax=Streptomyces sp. NPDC048305 TaxID=3365532 RepID=UPI00371A6621